LSGHVARIKERIGTCRFWWGKSPLGKPWRRWDDNIKMELEEVRRGMHELDWAGSE
jgi:hypothetical protein